MKEAYFKALVEAMEDLVYVCGNDFTIKYMNSSMVRYLGRSAVGERCYEAFFQSDAPCSWCRHKEVILSKKIVRHEITCPNDGKIYAVTWTPVRLDDSEEDVSLTILHDITEIRNAQRELEERNAQLRHAQKMEALATLAAGIAHDFNNILGSIIGYASLLKGVLKGESDSQYVDLIEHAARRASKLVERLMAFSAKGYKHKIEFDLNDCVIGVVDILKQGVSKGIEFKLNLTPGLPNLLATRADVEHAIMNVCLNAVQAIEELNPEEPKGLVEIRTFFTKEREIPRNATRILPKKGHADYLAIEVKDTGKGISAEHRSKIFEPFFSTRDSCEATGLGLSMVYGILESHEGLIGLESEPNKGSIFTLYFPVKEESSLDPKEKIKHESKQTCYLNTNLPGKILVVDDEAMLRDLLKEVLEAKGYSVITASNGAAAVEIYEKKKGEIDLVILDMLMPGMSGLETFRLLKEVDQNIRAVISSGYVDKNKVVQLKREGVLDFIAKPFSVSELTSKVQRFLKKD